MAVATTNNLGTLERLGPHLLLLVLEHCAPTLDLPSPPSKSPQTTQRIKESTEQFRTLLRLSQASKYLRETVLPIFWSSATFRVDLIFRSPNDRHRHDWDVIFRSHDPPRVRINPLVCILGPRVWTLGSRFWHDDKGALHRRIAPRALVSATSIPVPLGMRVQIQRLRLPLSQFRFIRRYMDIAKYISADRLKRECFDEAPPLKLFSLLRSEASASQMWREMEFAFMPTVKCLAVDIPMAISTLDQPRLEDDHLEDDITRWCCVHTNMSFKDGSLVKSSSDDTATRKLCHWKCTECLFSTWSIISDALPGLRTVEVSRQPIDVSLLISHNKSLSLQMKTWTTNRRDTTWDFAIFDDDTQNTDSDDDDAEDYENNHPPYQTEADWLYSGTEADEPAVLFEEDNAEFVVEMIRDESPHGVRDSGSWKLGDINPVLKAHDAEMVKLLISELAKGSDRFEQPGVSKVQHGV